MFVADLHIHSRYSRATSPELTFEQRFAWGRRKGVSLIGALRCRSGGGSRRSGNWEYLSPRDSHATRTTA